MNKHLDEYLCKKYPKIFAERNAPMTQTCMCWGFPGDGWFHLIDGMCGAIQNHIDQTVYRPADGFFNNLKQSIRMFLLNRTRIPYKILNKILHVEWGEYPSGIPQVVAQQVKEKFGTLRFYYSGGEDYISNVVSFAEYLSGRICENCGAMNEKVGHTSGWITTVCAVCNTRPENWQVRDPNTVEVWQKRSLDKENLDQ
jgi:hypothetical protein